MDGGSFVETRLHERLDLVELPARVDGADIGVLVERITDAQCVDATQQLVDHQLCHRLVHQQSRPGTTDVPLIEVDAVHDALDRLVDGGILEDDVGGLAAEFECELLARAGHRALDRLADRGRARERDLVDILVRDERRAGCACTGNDVHDAGRKVSLLYHFGQQKRRQWGRLGRLEHYGVARRKCGRDLPRSHQQREVPRDHLCRDPERAHGTSRERVVQLVGPTRVVEEVRRGQRHVDVTRFFDRLAAIERFEHGELARSLLQDACDAVQVFRPLRATHVAPHFVVGLPRGAHGSFDIGVAGLGHHSQLGLGGRIDGGEILTRSRLDEVAVDEQLVAIRDLHDGRRLERSGVVERRRCDLEVFHSGRCRDDRYVGWAFVHGAR